MQGSDAAVFKVPKPKKRTGSGINLICHETLADLDESWDSPPKTTPFVPKCEVMRIDNISQKTMNQMTGRSKSCSKESFQETQKHTFRSSKDPQRALLNDPMLNSGAFEESSGSVLSMESLLTHDSDDNIIWQPLHSNDKYTIGLLEEFTRGSNSSSAVPTISEMDWSVPDLDWYHETQNEQNGMPNSNKLRPHSVSTSTHADHTEDEVTYTRDILLVRDESMANADSDSSGSDVDWDSLTPPVPGSPSDHRVPDLAHMSSPTHREQSFLYDNFLMPPQSSESRSRNPYNLHTMTVPSVGRLSDDFGLDQTVPDFLL